MAVATRARGRTPARSGPLAFGKGSAMTLDRLRECESSIEVAEKALRDVQPTLDVASAALREIHDQEGYKLDGYRSFADYCQRRWHISRQAGYNRIAQAETPAAPSQRAAKRERRLPAGPEILEAGAQTINSIEDVPQAIVEHALTSDRPVTVAPDAETREAFREIASKAMEIVGPIATVAGTTGPTVVTKAAAAAEEAEVVAAVKGRAAVRHNAHAQRAIWSNAMGRMRELVRSVSADDLWAALTTAEREETVFAMIEWSKWIAEFRRPRAERD